jgi:hypothetical protein
VTPRELQLMKQAQRDAAGHCPRCQRPLVGRARCHKPDSESCLLVEAELLRAQVAKLNRGPSGYQPSPELVAMLTERADLRSALEQCAKAKLLPGDRLIFKLHIKFAKPAKKAVARG